MSNNVWAIGIVIVSALCAAVSQLLLKLSAGRAYDTKWRMYLNARVIAAYALLFSTTFLNMFAMLYLPYKIVPVLNALSYIFVVILGKRVLKERISVKKLGGLALVLAGVIIFNL